MILLDTAMMATLHAPPSPARTRLDLNGAAAATTGSMFHVAHPGVAGVTGRDSG